MKLWLALFKAETEEELAKIESMEVTVMTEAIEAYRHVSATDEFKEIERLRALARHNEASALHNARNEGWTEGRNEGEQIGARRERKKWEGKVREQAVLIAQLQARLDSK